MKLSDLEKSKGVKIMYLKERGEDYLLITSDRKAFSMAKAMVENDLNLKIVPMEREDTPNLEGIRLIYTDKIKQGDIDFRYILKNEEEIITKLSAGDWFDIRVTSKNLVAVKNLITVYLKENKELITYILDYCKEFVVNKTIIPISNNLRIKLSDERFFTPSELDLYLNQENRTIGEADEFLDSMMKFMFENKTSDISLAPMDFPKRRFKKELIPIDGYDRLKPTDCTLLQDEFFNRGGIHRRRFYNEKGYARLATSLPGYGRYRFVMMNQRGTPAYSLRYIPFEIRPIEDFRLPKMIKNKFLSGRGGLYLIGGEPNSGKSTLAAAIINEYLKTTRKKVVTLENPIEYLFKHQQGQVTQHEIGTDVLSYEDAIVALLTFDPDIVYFTEIKEGNELLNAIEMASSGKLVISTGHAKNCEQLLKRMFGLISHDESAQIKLASVLELVMVQSLVPGIKTEVVPAQEIFNVLPNMKKILEDVKNFGSTVKSKLTQQGYGNREMANDLWNLVKQGKISEDQMYAEIGRDKSIAGIEYSEYLDSLESPENV